MVGGRRRVGRAGEFSHSSRVERVTVKLSKQDALIYVGECVSGPAQISGCTGRGNDASLWQLFEYYYHYHYRIIIISLLLSLPKCAHITVFSRYLYMGMNIFLSC